MAGHRVSVGRTRILLVAAVAVLAALPLAAGGCKAEAPALGPAEFLKQHNLQGRVALIEFGLIGCALSESGLDKMIQMNRDNRIPDLSYARVEASADARATDQYYAAKSPGFTVYRDHGTSLGMAFQATAYPTFVLLDKFGRVRYRGAWPEEARLAGWVESLKRESADPGPDVALFGTVAIDGPKLLAETRLPDLQDTVKPLRQRMGKQGVLAVFVDTTCPFSAEAVADMSKVSAALAKHEVSSLLVNVGEPKAAVAEFHAKRAAGIPVLYDATTDTQRQWDVASVPTVVMLGADGAVIYKGKAVWRDVAAAAEKGLELPAGSLNIDARGMQYG
jgi:hypothetical protein